MAAVFTLLAGFQAFHAEEGEDPYQWVRDESITYISIHAPGGTQLPSANDSRTVEVLVELHEWEIWADPNSGEPETRYFVATPIPSASVSMNHAPWNNNLDAPTLTTDSSGRGSTTYHNNGNTTPVAVTAEYNGSSASLTFEPPGNSPPQETWTYDHPEATISANITPSSSVDSVMIGESRQLNLHVELETWDMEISNLGNHRKVNSSTTPAAPPTSIGWSRAATATSRATITPTGEATPQRTF